MINIRINFFCRQYTEIFLTRFYYILIEHIIERNGIFFTIYRYREQPKLLVFDAFILYCF